MKKILTLFFVSGFVFCSWAQNTPITKSNYELPARFSPEKMQKMLFSTTVQPHFLKNSDRFWYSYETPKGKKWYIVDPVKGEKKELFNNAKMAEQITLITKDPFDAIHLPIENIKFTPDENSFIFEITSSLKEEKINPKTGKKEIKPKIFYLEYNLASGQVKELVNYEKPQNYPSWASVSPDGETILFSRNFNLYYMDKENFAKALVNENDPSIIEHQITTDGVEYYCYGGSSNNELNTEREANKSKRKNPRVTWSPDSKYFAMVRTDERKVNDLWVINSMAQPRPTLETYKYQMPGEENAPIYYLLVFDNSSKQYKTIDLSAYKDQTLRVLNLPKAKKNSGDIHQPNIWMGNNNVFYVTRTSRDFRRTDICSVNPVTGETKSIIEERANKYVEPHTPYYVPETDEFIQWSERTGWAQLYLYGGDGTLKNQITNGDFHCENVLGVDAASRTVYFTANGKDANKTNPYYHDIYKVNMDGSGLKQLTKGDFEHEPILSDNNRYFIDNYSRVDTVPASALYDNTGRKILDLETADMSSLFAAGYKFPERFTVKAADGVTDLYGVMYKPYNFDSTKLYPVIEYVYPGPQHEGVNVPYTNEKMDRMDRLAQFGFIVVTIGNRGGHPGRSVWYHQYGYGNLRDYGLADKKAAIEQLAARYNFIDINKVGIHGHSGGGFMSTAAMLVYPDFFKVAVSCAGNHENNIYNRSWSEKHDGIEEIISEKGDTIFKYDIAKNSEVAKNLKGHLLVIHGDIDNNVHPANTIRLVNALIRANKRFDMLILPGQRHAFGDMTEYFFWRLGDYFSQHLIGDYQTSVDIHQLAVEKERKN